MDIKDLKNEKIKIEGELAIAIGDILKAFREKTGVPIESVSVSMTHITTIGKEVDEYIVRNVSCEIAF